MIVYMNIEFVNPLKYIVNIMTRIKISSESHLLVYIFCSWDCLNYVFMLTIVKKN